MQKIESKILGSGRRLTRSLTAADMGVYVLIVGLGALQFGLNQRSADFVGYDTTYAELARSIVQGRSYGFDFRPETTLPPGFPVILAALCATLGRSHAVLVRSMAVFATLGFLVCYELLRRKEGRAMAATICLLLASSPLVFSFATTRVMSDLPYFFTSMLALLLATRLDAAKSVRRRVVLSTMCGVLLVGSLLVRSSGITLFIGLAAWLAVSFFADRKAAAVRLKVFVPLLLAGIVVQASWMLWAKRREVTPEWPLGGYRRSYLSQVTVKSGNQPELGAASLGDIPARVEENAIDRASGLVTLLTRKTDIAAVWYSPLILGPMLLVLVGVGRSIWRTGGRLEEWYFVSHEAMYLLWPWDFVMRFFLPVAPLACLYLWRGGKTLVGLASQKPRVVGAWSFPLAVLIGAFACASAWDSSSVQLKLAALFWVGLAAASAWMAWSGSRRRWAAFDRLLPHWAMASAISGKASACFQAAGAVLVATLFSAGVAMELSIGRDNLAFDVTKDPEYPDIEAATWIRAHTSHNAVVMARQLDVVYHYAHRRVVWFPPSSNPELLMEGIRKLNVEYIVVHDREDSYWLPPEKDCFSVIFSAHPEAFRIVHQGFREKVYAIS